MLTSNKDNPYLDEFLAAGHHPSGDDFMSGSFTGVGDYLNRMKAQIENQTDRMSLVNRYAWAVPGREAIDAIASLVITMKLAGIVEIGAGTGYWARTLSRAGLDVVAYDSFEWFSNRGKDMWFDVQRGGTPAVEKHPDRALLLCWPPMDSHRPKIVKMGRRRAVIRSDNYERYEAWESRRPNMGGSAISRYKGDWLIYVGEGSGGCTGDRRMWEMVEEGWKVETEVDIPRFFGMRDYLTIYRRKAAICDSANPKET